MAYLTLSGHGGVVTDPLPPICMACGRAATVFNRHTFRDKGNGQSIRVRVPRCNGHKDLPGASGSGWMLLVVVGFLLLTAVAMMMPGILARREITQLQALFLFLSIPVVLLAAGLLICGQLKEPSDNVFSSWVSDVTDHGITFHEVSEVFMAAYRKEQHKRTDEMPGGFLQTE